MFNSKRKSATPKEKVLSFIEGGKKNLKICIGSLMALLGAILFFSSVCLKQTLLLNPSLEVSPTIPLGIEWYLAIFYLFLTGTLVGTSITDSIPRYKLALVAFIVLALAYIPAQIETSLAATLLPVARTVRGRPVASQNNDIRKVFSTDARFSTAGALASTGLIMISMPLFLIITWLGSDEKAPINNILANLPTRKQTV